MGDWVIPNQLGSELGIIKAAANPTLFLKEPGLMEYEYE